LRRSVREDASTSKAVSEGKPAAGETETKKCIWKTEGSRNLRGGWRRSVVVGEKGRTYLKVPAARVGRLE